MQPFPSDGLLLFAKRDCETCAMIEPVMAELAAGELPLTVVTQDDPAFPASLTPVDDTALRHSFRFEIETVPTLTAEGRAGDGPDLRLAPGRLGVDRRDEGPWRRSAGHAAGLRLEEPRARRP